MTTHPPHDSHQWVCSEHRHEQRERSKLYPGRFPPRRWRHRYTQPILMWRGRSIGVWQSCARQVAIWALVHSMIRAWEEAEGVVRVAALLEGARDQRRVLLGRC